MSEYTTTPGSHTAGAPPTDDAHQENSNTSLGELFSDLSQNVSTLVRQEAELAKAELRESARAAGKGVGLYGGAGIAGNFVLLFLSLAAMFGLSLWVGYGWSALIVAVVWAIIAAVMAAVAKKQFKSVKGLPKTTETIKDIPPAFNPKEETP
jgi:hypothetical protein